MLLKSLKLLNFKSFAGEHTLDLSVPGEVSQPNRNIILIGGMNGSGKTSLLEAVKLCLYGRDNRGLWPRSQSYETYIVECLNNIAGRTGKAEKMSVTLEFEGVVLKGIPHAMTITREWLVSRVDQATLNRSDKPVITLDGKPFAFVEEAYWQDFIRDFIPIEVSNFFFFDGEKIQLIADEIDHQELESSIKDVLGLSIYGTLETDIKALSDRFRRDADRVSSSKLTETEADIQRSEEKIENSESNIRSLTIEIEDCKSVVAQLEREITRISGAVVSNLEEAREEHDRVRTELNDLNANIIELFGEQLPFAIAGGVCHDLYKRLKAEDILREWEQAKTAFEPKTKSIVDGLFGDKAEKPDPVLTASQRKFLAKRLQELISSSFEPKPAGAADRILHDLSRRDYELIVQTLEALNQGLPGKLDALSREKEQKVFTLDKLDKILSRAPEDSQSRITFEKRDSILKDIGRKEQQVDRESEVVSDLQRTIQGLLREKAHLEDNLKVARKQRAKVDVCNKVQATVREYSQKLKSRRIDDLETHITKMYKLLYRKGEMIENVDIDPSTFDVNLHGKDGEVINKRNLSAGEKQIYAISLLWGLARASDKSLPIIIDTPFGRLDSEHRHNIVKQYFPHASPQVVILSTDTELKGENYDLIKKYIHRAYTLNYDKRKQTTSITEGYTF